MTAFTDALEAALIAHNPQRTNTPVEVLAQHMADSLRAFESTLLARSRHPFFAPGKPDAPVNPHPVAAADGPDHLSMCDLASSRFGRCPACEDD